MMDSVLLPQKFKEVITLTPFHLCFLFLLLFFSIVCFVKFTRGNGGCGGGIRSGQILNLPPSPPMLPIIGNLHQLGALPHRSLCALSKKYGSLMFLRLGQAPTLVVSSAEMAREVMKTQDVGFADRTRSTASDIFLNGPDIAFSPYGEYWRQFRKVAILELLSQNRVQSFQYVREEEVDIMVNEIRRLSCQGTAASVNLTEILLAVTNSIISRVVLGRKFAQEDGKNKYGEASRKVTAQFACFSFRDYFPSVGWLDKLTGLISKLKMTAREIHSLFDYVIQEKTKMSSQKEDESEKKDFVDILLQLRKGGMLDFELTLDNLKAILMDMVVGGTDTSTAMEWIMAELVKRPSMMKKAQEEVRRVVGKKRKVDVDLNQLQCLKSVIKETFRLHPPLIFLLPRQNSAVASIGGYEIPPRTRVLINAWAIQRDPEHWDRPDEFLPERFDNSPVDFRGQDFQFVPFGSGRRGCPGMTLGTTTIENLSSPVSYTGSIGSCLLVRLQKPWI